MNSIEILRIIRRLGLTDSAKRIRRLLQSLSLWPKKGFGYPHRDIAYAMLSGRGLEVGALNFPAAVPAGCVMEYCDAYTREEAAAIFPEVNSGSLVTVNHVINLDSDSLFSIQNSPYDFVIMNHVIEHVACPIAVIEQLFSVLKDEGILVISAPDKEFCFDKNRPLTTFEHLLEEYRQGIRKVNDDHYLDLIRYNSPDIFIGDDSIAISNLLELQRSRREHAHVWDSESFLSFLRQSIAHLGLNASILFESSASENDLECMVVIRKTR
jgi:SAM-dependent methyltransferase